MESPCDEPNPALDLPVTLRPLLRRTSPEADLSRSPTLSQHRGQPLYLTTRNHPPPHRSRQTPTRRRRPRPPRPNHPHRRGQHPPRQAPHRHNPKTQADRKIIQTPARRTHTLERRVKEKSHRLEKRWPSIHLLN